MNIKLTEINKASNDRNWTISENQNPSYVLVQSSQLGKGLNQLTSFFPSSLFLSLLLLFFFAS